MEAWSFGLNENEEVRVTYFAYTSIAAKECVMMYGRVLFSDTTEEEEEEEKNYSTFAVLKRRSCQFSDVLLLPTRA